MATLKKEWKIAVRFVQKNSLSKVIYHIFLFAYSNGIRIASLWNLKARQWVNGRRKFPSIANHPGKTIWMHCASLGEFEQGRPLLESIRIQYPNITIVLTFFSPSGYEIRKDYKGADYIFYLPMDGMFNAKKMVDAINPSLVIWVKYEYWYYYLSEFKKRDIPVLMVSGIYREDQAFFQWYGAIWKKMLGCFTYFFVQNEKSKSLLNKLDFSNNVNIAGDTRFDRVIEIAEKFEPLPLIEKFCGISKVVVAGSTWEEDEEEWTHYVKAHPQIKFIIAPHEIGKENLEDVKKEFPNSIFYSELEKLNGDIENHVHVLIIDNIGMLSKLYRYAHITFVGGGFGNDGIHNVLEAAVYGRPVIYGPNYEKFTEAVELIETGAGICINNALELEKVMSELWHNENLLKEKSAVAKNYVYSKAGATKKIMEYIQANRLLTN